MTGAFREAYHECRLCGHQCGADRLSGETGVCGLGTEPLIASVAPHFGEEPELVGWGGSGTIFFAGCNLGCCFCQNWEISHGRQGEPVTVGQLMRFMLDLERRGCHNVNLVTPTPFTPSILEAILAARDAGLSVPIVYNCGGYESPEALHLCNGLIEIYMPDAKYSDAFLAERLSGAPDYPQVNRAALLEMHRQVGDLEVRAGVAARGLLVRHLVLPNQPENTRGVVEFLAGELSRNTYVNVMDQYRPCYHTLAVPGLDRRLSAEEYTKALEVAARAGLHRGLSS